MNPNLEERDGGVFYTGPLEWAQAAVAGDRHVVVAVYLCDDPSNPEESAAEYGFGYDAETAWRFALGAYLCEEV